jgi:hypothetical protein
MRRSGQHFYNRQNLVMRKLSIIIILVIIGGVWGCNSSKKSLQSGNYYSSVMQSVTKLRKSPNNKKSRESLSMAYPLAVDQFLGEVNRMKSGQDRFKNGKIVDSYKLLNNMHDEIRRCPAALEVIPNPEDFYSQLKFHAQQAAEERFLAGEEALAMNSRPYAIEAYDHFIQADLYLPGYRNVKDKIEEALYYATLKVLVDQVPVPSMQAGLSAQFFQDQIEQFLFNYQDNRFIRFYSTKDQNLKEPDQILVFQFDDFVVGQVNNQERIIEASQDSVVLAKIPKSSVETQTQSQNDQKVVICHSPPGNPENAKTLEVSVSALQAHIDHGDKIGPCDGDAGNLTASSSNVNVPKEEYINVYGTVKAVFRENTRQVISRGLLSMRIMDAKSNTVVLHEKFPGEFVWINQWGSFNGDERALTAEQLKIANQQPMQPPPPQNLFMEFCRPIYGQVTSKVRSYYHNL